MHFLIHIIGFQIEPDLQIFALCMLCLIELASQLISKLNEYTNSHLMQVFSCLLFMFRNSYREIQTFRNALD